MRYIVSVNSGLYTFYSEPNGLFWSQYLGSETWSTAESFFEGRVEHFSVSLCKGRVLVVYQTAILAKRVVFENGEFFENLLVEGGLDGTYYGVAIDGGEDTFLVHNLPISREYSHILMSHKLGSDGSWSGSKNLGRIIPFTQKYAFDMIPVRNNHFLMFYQVQASGFGADLGFREVYGNKIGSFNIVEKNANINGMCNSFLASHSEIFITYMVKGILSPALYYVKKDEHGFSQKITIASGNNIHSPLIYLKNGKLNLLYMRGDDIFSTELAKNNLSFVQHKEKASSYTRCRFLHENNINSDFYANEILIDTSNPKKLRILDGLASFDKLVKPSKIKSKSIPKTSPQKLKAGNQEEYISFFNNF